MSQGQSIPAALHQAAERARPQAARPPREVCGVPLRLVGVLYIPIALLLLPFADHHSRDPVCLTYSWDYLVVLVVLAVGGLAAAFALGWMVRGAPPHRRLSFALVLLAMPVGTILILESYLGYRERDAFAAYRARGHAKSPFMGFESAPNARWENRGVVYTTDGNRFRTHVGPRVKPEDETLIAVLGGSTAFGFGLNDDETWVHYLEQELRACCGDEVTVLNAAVLGHNSLQQLFRFYLRALPLKPDYVLYYGLINDLRTADQLAGSLIWMPEEVLEAHSVRDYLRQKNQGKGFYVENSVLLNRLRNILEEAVSRSNPDEPSDEEAAQRNIWRQESIDPAMVARVYGPAAEMHLRNLDSLRILCEANGIRFIPITFVAESGKMARDWSMGFDYLSRAFRECCTRSDVALLDLRPAFERIENKTELFLTDHYHPSHKGAEFISTHVAEALAPIIVEGLRREESDNPRQARAASRGHGN